LDVEGLDIEGEAGAQVVIAEFSDFQCPFCKRWFDETLPQLRERLGEDVALAFLHFPIVQLHPNAGNAGAAAVCAAEQGKFWEMHDLLFERQAEWEGRR
jgi:protein-disulfide isomerase